MRKRKEKKEENQVMMNKELERTIEELKANYRKTGQSLWAALSDELNRSKRKRNSVNLSQINRLTKEGDIAAVPGKVLASGTLDHQVTIAAFSFSDAALDKIKTFNSEAKTITQLATEGVELSKVKIIK